MGWSRRIPGRFDKNYLTYSQTFGNAIWQKWYSAVVGSKVLAPDGTMTADSITGAAGCTLAQLAPAAYCTVGAKFVASVYGRVVTTATSAPFIAVLDVLDGQPNNVVNMALTTSWKRFSVSGTIAAGGANWAIEFGNLPSNQAIELWGAQLVFGTQTLGKYRATADRAIF